MDFLKDKIRVTLENLNRHLRLWEQEIDGFSYMETAYKTDNVLPCADDPRFTVFEGKEWRLGGDRHAWFYKHVVLPEEVVGQQTRMEIFTGTRGWNVRNPQFIAYVDGKMVQGLDVNHTTFLLGNKREYDLYLYAYTGSVSQDLKFSAKAYISDPLCRKVYYDIRIPYELLDCLNPLTKEYADILEYLNTATNFIDLRQAPNGDFRTSLAAAAS